MSSPFYGGPCLAGEALDANVFVTIDASATPDNVIELDSDTGIVLGVTTRAIASGEQCLGVVVSPDQPVKIKMASGQSVVANEPITATTGGEGKAAVAGDVVHALALEPTSGGYTMGYLNRAPFILPS